jgi:hypothetical protein
MRPRDLFDNMLVGQMKESLRLVGEPDVSFEIAGDRVHPSPWYAADSGEPAVVQISNGL